MTAAAAACGGGGEQATAISAVKTYEPGSTPPPPPPEVHLPDPIEPSAGGGSLPSEISVTPSGALSYEIPLDVPAGRADVAPVLRLAYSSHSGNGPVGMGWHLAGAASSISRCVKTWANDGVTDGLRFSISDNLCLDGAVMVKVSETASYQEYRTKSDAIARIRGYSVGASGADYFRVWRKDGTIQTYRHRTDSRWQFSNGALVGGDAVRAIWLLENAEDGAGNRMSFEYDQEIGDDLISKQVRLARIRYTANSNINQQAQRRIELIYGARPDPSYRWLNGIKLNEHERLTRIEMWAPNPGAVERVWHYELGYTQSARTQRSLLASVRKCGHEGTCTWTRRFTYAQAPVNHDARGGFDVRNVIGSVIGDFDGDGRDDILREEEYIDDNFPPGHQEIRELFLVRTAADAASNVPLQPEVALDHPFALAHSLAVDINGDGKDELIAFNRGLCKPGIYRWDGAEFVSAGSLPVQPTGLGGECEGADGEIHPRAIVWADLDGDGRVDRVRHETDTNQPTYNTWVYERNLNGWQFAPPEPTGVPANGRAAAVNLNGDGRPEIVLSGGGLLGVNAQGQIGLMGTEPLVGPASRFADINGDGLADLVYLKDDEISYRWNSGNGFGPVETVTDPDVVDTWNMVADPDKKERFLADVNNDGRTDIIMALHEVEHAVLGCDPNRPSVSDSCSELTETMAVNLDHYYFLIATGDASFEKVLWRKESTGLHARGLAFGDFDGDGITDLMNRFSFANRSWLSFFTMSPAPSDVIINVADDGLAASELMVTYGRTDPGAWASSVASFPLAVPRTSAQVVRVLEGLRFPGGQFYRFEDPRSDLQGHGFLGYRTMREYAPAVPTEITRIYDNSTRVNGRYPFAGLPTEETTVTAILPHEWRGALPCVPGVDEICSWNGPATATGRVQKRTYAWTELAPTVHTHITVPGQYPQETAQVAETWEEPIEITWAPSAPVHLHHDGIGERDALVRQLTDVTHDAFGNETFRRETTLGGVVHTLETEYENRTGPWQIGLVRRTEESSNQQGQSAEVRTTEHWYDLRGIRQYTMWEPNHPTLFHWTEWTVDSGGRVTRSAEHDGTGLEPSRYHYWAYDDVSGEGIHPSVTWNERGQAHWTWIHPAYGFAMKTMNMNGKETDVIADDLGHVVRVMPEGGIERSTSWTPVVDIHGEITGMEFHDKRGDGSDSWTIRDLRGRAIEHKQELLEPATNTVEYAVDRTDYDLFGRVLRRYRPGRNQHGSGASETSYDSLGRITDVASPDGTGVSFTHSFFRSEAIDRAGHRRWSEVDKDGRIVRSAEIHNGQPLVVHTTYTDFGQVQSTTDAAGNVTSFVYDKLGRRLIHSDPDSGVTVTAYNAFGEPTSITDALGLVRSFQSDELGRLTQVTESQPAPLAPEVATYHWDVELTGQGQVGHTVSADGVETKTAFDDLGRPRQKAWVIDGASYEIETGYDAYGRVATVAYPEVPGHPRFTIAYEYHDETGALMAVEEVASDGSTRDVWRIREYADDGTIAALELGNGVEERLFRDQTSGRLDAMQIGQPGQAPLYGTGYYYDPQTGRLDTRVDASTGRTEGFVHDDLGRLVSWKVADGATAMTLEYDYDDLGNLERVTRTGVNPGVLANNQYGTVVNGALVRPHAVTVHNGAAITYDAIGRATHMPDRVITYTRANLPRTITAGNAVTTFSYDAHDARVRKSGPAGETITIGGLYEKRVSASGVVHVFYAPGLNGPVAQFTYSAAGEERAYLHRDALGSVGLATDENGDEIADSRYYYEPFGGRVQASGLAYAGAAPDLRLGFTGHEHDDDLALINMKGRMYDPTLRRFISPDPLIADSASVQAFNRYSYVRNNPLHATDPTGYQEIIYEIPDDGQEIVVQGLAPPDEPTEVPMGGTHYQPTPYAAEHNGCPDGACNPANGPRNQVRMPPSQPRDVVMVQCNAFMKMWNGCVNRPGVPSPDRFLAAMKGLETIIWAGGVPIMATGVGMSMAGVVTVAAGPSIIAGEGALLKCGTDVRCQNAVNRIGERVKDTWRAGVGDPVIRRAAGTIQRQYRIPNKNVSVVQGRSVVVMQEKSGVVHVVGHGSTRDIGGLAADDLATTVAGRVNLPITGCELHACNSGTVPAMSKRVAELLGAPVRAYIDKVATLSTPGLGPSGPATRAFHGAGSVSPQFPTLEYSLRTVTGPGGTGTVGWAPAVSRIVGPF